MVRGPHGTPITVRKKKEHTRKGGHRRSMDPWSADIHVMGDLHGRLGGDIGTGHIYGVENCMEKAIFATDMYGSGMGGVGKKLNTKHAMERLMGNAIK